MDAWEAIGRTRGVVGDQADPLRMVRRWGAASGSATAPSISPQVGTRTTALIRTILDMQFMATPRATMVELTSARGTLAVIVAARTPVVETVAEKHYETVKLAADKHYETAQLFAGGQFSVFASTLAKFLKN